MQPPSEHGLRFTDASRQLLVVTTGGTIASLPDPATGALVSIASAVELLASLDDRGPPHRLRLHEFCNLGSNRIDLDMGLRLARWIGAALDDEAVAGCVVTLGTDTMEEIAFLASLVLPVTKPVVFTGAQRSGDRRDADGPSNLADALRVAAHPEAQGLGVTVVFGGRIIPAVGATKVHASHVAAFDGGEYGSIGEVDDGAVHVARRLARYPRIDISRMEPRVDLLTLSLGCDDRLMRAAIDTGARGIVLAAFGRGNATPVIVDAVAQAHRAGIPTVVASRCPLGRVLPLYGDGGGKDLEASGAIFAGRLGGPKSRILLSAALADVPMSGLRALFDSFGR